MSNAIGSKITRVYSNFRGVDFRGEEINLVRSPDALNVWKDYKNTESIRTRPGMRLIQGTDDWVNGIYSYKNRMLVHYGNKLGFAKSIYGFQILFEGASNGCSNGFIFENIFYFMDGINYLQYDGDTCKPVEGYVPKTSIARKPNGGGTMYQDINMLSDYRINEFRGDGQSKDFYLDTMKIDDDFKPEVKVNDKAVTDFTVNYTEGKITFNTAPAAPRTDGQDNVSIKFKKAMPGYRDRILKCTLVQVFDNRVFVSGNPDAPNTVWHCSLNDPTYFSDTDYYREGTDDAKVKGMVAGNNGLWVFREPSEANTSIFYHTPTTDDDYGKIYPSVHSSVATGCIGKAINFNDDIVFFSDRGMEGISGDVTTEQVVEHRSSLVDRKLLAEDDYDFMILEEWEGYLLVIFGDRVYLADSRTAFMNEDHVEYDWFYWQLEHEISAAMVHNGVLFLGTQDGVYTLDNYNTDIESWWTTPLDKFQHPQHQKTTNKRGSVAEATGDISVYAKTEKTDFELIGTHENVTDYFVSRIKRKKFKDLQLKFYSKTRFSLETVTLEAYIGGYIKR